MTSLYIQHQTAAMVIAQDDIAAERLQSLLDEPASVGRGADIRGALAADPERLLLLLWHMPVDHVQRAIEAGDDGAVALAEWREATRDALASFDDGRDRILVIDAQMLKDDPEAIAQAITARTALVLPAPEPAAKTNSDSDLSVSAQDTQALEELDGLPLILAAALLSADQAAMELASKLSAIALSPVGRALPDADLVTKAVARIQNARNAGHLFRDEKSTAITADAAGLSVMLEETEVVANNWARRCGALERELHTLHAERILMAEGLRHALNADGPTLKGQPDIRAGVARQRLHQDRQFRHDSQAADALTVERTMAKEVLRLAALLRTTALRAN